MNYDFYEVNGVSYFSYNEAYSAYINSDADILWGCTIKGYWVKVHSKMHGF